MLPKKQKCFKGLSQVLKELVEISTDSVNLTIIKTVNKNEKINQLKK